MDLTNNERGLELCSGIRTWDILVNTRYCACSLLVGSTSYNALTILTLYLRIVLKKKVVSLAKPVAALKIFARVVIKKL